MNDEKDTGNCNTVTPDECLIFNKPGKRSEWERAEKPNWMFVNLTKWVNENEMTDNEMRKAFDKWFSDKAKSEREVPSARECFEAGYGLALQSRLDTAPSVDEDGLLPCPFCGSRNVGDYYKYMVNDPTNYITCQDCCADGPCGRTCLRGCSRVLYAFQVYHTALVSVLEKIGKAAVSGSPDAHYLGNLARTALGLKELPRKGERV